MKDAMPAILGHFNPRRLVVRGESDVWNPSLEDITSNTYDYVKLHRISGFIEVPEIVPSPMAICFDGTLAIPALPELRDVRRARSVFNRMLAELLVGGLYCEAVSPDDMGAGFLTSTGYSCIMNSGDGPAAMFSRAARTKHLGAYDSIYLLDPPKITMVELLERLAEGRGLLNAVGEIPQEQVLYGTTFYVRKQWAEALIHIWTTTERLIELAWQKHVISSAEKRSGKERDFLNDHRSWPASTKIEVLFQKSLLPHSVLVLLDEVRKARNDLAHKGVQPSHDLATKALQGCFQLASLCSSDFKETNRFDKVISTVIQKCNPQFYPKERVRVEDCTHWLGIPPMPWDPSWGDKPYEIIREVCLKAISPTDEVPHKSSPQSPTN